MKRRRLDRYVIREVAGPAALGFVVYTFLLLMQGLFALMEQIFVRGVALQHALELLALTLPHVVVLTIPMSFLFGVLLAVGRMNGDNEIVALLAAGVPPRRLLPPILLFAAGLTALNGYLYVEVIPSANRQLRERKIQLFASAKGLGRIEPGIFHEDFPNLLVFVEDVDETTGYWRNVLLFDSSDTSEERLILARRGRVVARNGANASDVLEGDREPWILLEDVVNHQFIPSKPETHRINRNQEQLYRLPLPDQGTVRYVPGVRERGTIELLRFIRSGGRSGLDADSMTGEERRMKLRQAGLELHQRFAIPTASLVFGLLALPLGIGARSGGRGRGFILSIAVVLAYYVTNNHGALLALEGRIPVWLGVWLPNIVLSTTAAIMMLRVGRWLGERRSGEGWVAAGIEAWRRWRRRRARRRGSEPADETLTGSIPVAIQRRRYGSRFPTLLDRYLLRRMISPLAIVLVSCCALYVVVDLTDHVDEMAKNDAPLGVILAYYWNLIPQVVMDVTPFALMIGTLVLFSVLERQHELTALKGSGISVYRLMVPVVLVAMVAVVLLWVLGDSVLPEANRDATRLLDRIKGRETTRSYQAANRQWLLSEDGSTLYNFLRYDDDSRTLVRFTMYELTDQMRLRSHLFAHRVRFTDQSWVADSGWFRRFYPNGQDEFRRIGRPMELDIPERPSYFGQDYRRPEEMRVAELARYIRELEVSGYEPTQQIVRLHQKFSYPLSALVMILLALPFGLNRGGRRVTTMQSVAVALGLGITYFVAVAVFSKMGEADVLPPLVGAWAPALLAVLMALNRMATIRT